MRKIIIMISTLMIVSMLLAACAGEETSTAVPGAEVTPLTEEPMTEAPETEEPAGTETVAPTEEGTPGAGIPVTGEEDPSRLSNQLDYDVWNGEGDQIGEVNDMIVDLGESRISYVIVGTGGFLEIGERDILVPWDQLELQTATGDDATGDENAFILLADQETFENAPDVDVTAVLPPMGEPVLDWDVDIRNYWEGGGAAVPEATGTVAPDTADDDVTVTGELQGVILASDLLGSGLTVGADGTVVMEDQETPVAPGTAVTTPMADATATPGTDTTTTGEVQNGMVDDVIVDIDTGDILYIVIVAAFDDGDRWIPVPLDQFQWDASNGILVLNVDPVTLQDAPSFLDGQYPDTTADGWDAEFSTFWQTGGTGDTGGTEPTATP